MQRSVQPSLIHPLIQLRPVQASQTQVRPTHTLWVMYQTRYGGEMCLFTRSRRKSVRTPVILSLSRSFLSATSTPSITASSKSSLSSPSLLHPVHAHIISTTNPPVHQHRPIVPSSQSDNQALLLQYPSTTSPLYGLTNSTSARIFSPFNHILLTHLALLTLRILSKSNKHLPRFPPTTCPVLLTHPYIFSCPL